MKSLWIVLIAAISQASILRFPNPSTSTISVSGLKIPLYRDALVDIPESFNEVSVYLTGHGVYAKPVGFISAEVYYAQHFLDCESGFSDKTNPLGDLSQAYTYALYFTYLRDLSASQIRDAFEDMLSLNSIDIEDPEVQASLNRLTFDVSKGEKSFLVGRAFKRRFETLYLEVHDHYTFDSGADLAFKFWHSWFGIPIDNGMKKLKTLLIGKRGIQ